MCYGNISLMSNIKPEPEPILIDPSRTAQIAVHVQRYFFKPGSPRASEERRQPFVDATVDVIDATASALSQAGVRTFWACMKNTDVDDVTGAFYKVSPLPGDEIVKDNECSAIKTGNMRERLKKNRVDTVIVSGGYASICVTETVKDALKAGLRVIVMTDCLVDNQDEIDLTGMFTSRSARNRPIFMRSDEVLASLGQPRDKALPVMPALSAAPL